MPLIQYMMVMPTLGLLAGAKLAIEMGIPLLCTVLNKNRKPQGLHPKTQPEALQSVKNELNIPER